MPTQEQLEAVSIAAAELAYVQGLLNKQGLSATLELGLKTQLRTLEGILEERLRAAGIHTRQPGPPDIREAHRNAKKPRSRLS